MTGRGLDTGCPQKLYQLRPWRFASTPQAGLLSGPSLSKDIGLKTSNYQVAANISLRYTDLMILSAKVGINP